MRAHKDKKWINKGFLLLFITFCLILSASTWLNDEFNGLKTQKPFHPSYHLVLMSTHAPISIVGNSSFTEANGVKNESVLGTKDDPFIIENWAISTSGFYGIELRQTTAFVIIRNCLITRGNDDSGKGIYLYTSSNILLQNNTMHGFADGILIENSHNVTAYLNQAWDEIRGITLDNSYNCTIRQNYANGHYWSGIRLDQSSSNYIVDNEVENSTGGIYILQSINCLVVDNYCHHNKEEGLEFSWGNGNNTAYLNTLTKNYQYGIRLYTLDQDNEVYNNDFTLNGIGPMIGGGPGIDNVYNNTLSRPNEMQKSSLPDILMYNYTTKLYCKEYTLATFDTSAGPYQLVFKCLYQRNLNGTATLFLKSSVYTTTDSYITNTAGNFMYDISLNYNGSEFITFGYKSDSTSIIETSKELYRFPMCIQLVLETFESIDITLNLSYKLTSSAWSTIQSNFSTTVSVPSYTSNDTSIPGYPMILILIILLGIILIKRKVKAIGPLFWTLAPNN